MAKAFSRPDQLRRTRSQEHSRNHSIKIAREKVEREGMTIKLVAEASQDASAEPLSCRMAIGEGMRQCCLMLKRIAKLPDYNVANIPDGRIAHESREYVLQGAPMMLHDPVTNGYVVQCNVWTRITTEGWQPLLLSPGNYKVWFSNV